MGKSLPAGAVSVLLGAVLSGCVRDGGPGLAPGSPLLQSLPAPSAGTTLSSDGVHSTRETLGPDVTLAPGGHTPASLGLSLTGNTSSPDGSTPEAELAGGRTGALAGTPGSSEGATNRESESSGRLAAAGSGPIGLSALEYTHDNREAADLLDHWGHRQVQGIVEGLSLGTAAPAADGAGMQGISAGGFPGAGRLLASHLEDGDEVRLLGARHGITYGRWTGGPADTLSIDFDLSRAGPQMRYNPAFRAALERSGKAWSRRLEDTWAAWDRASGAHKGRLPSDSGLEHQAWVGANGETSTRLEIDVTDDDISGGFAGKGGSSGWIAPGRPWEPRFGTVRIDRKYLEDPFELQLFSLLVHEIGHVIGAWSTWALDEYSGLVESHVDRVAGAWTGPNVVALHGGPAPFQDAANPHAWVNGERSPLATQFDFAHSGVCSSIMAYCSSGDPRPAFLPHAIDFAFLADLGMTVTDETDRPETYGLAGWTDHAGFSVSVSRDLRIDPSDNRSKDGLRYRQPIWLDVIDVLQAEVDVFGHPSLGGLLQSYPAAGLQGMVRYAGGLLGAAIDRSGLPPVTGDASIAIDLGTFAGEASFTSLTVHAGGAPETFAGGSLHYPLNVSGNSITGSGDGATLRAGFYGAGPEEVAGTLEDSSVGLLASFGTTRDGRPSRDDVVVSADYLLGGTYRSGAADPAHEGWTQYGCGTESGCTTWRVASDGSIDRAATTRSEVLFSTAGWNRRSSERLLSDRDFVRIARQSVELTDSRQGLLVADGYTGTLEHVAFGVGYERFANWSELAEGPSPELEGSYDRRNDAPPDLEGSYDRWFGIQGSLSGIRPGGAARWFGTMLGYQDRRPAGHAPFVEGFASIEYSLSDNLVDVAFSGVRSRDGRRLLPDFTFADVAMREDGTFGHDGTAGSMGGALFGPGREEVAGAFYHETTDVTGSFGARRVPVAAQPEESEPVASASPVVELRGERWIDPRTSHVGADSAPALDELATGAGYRGVAVSSGPIRDGAGAENVVEYLKQQIGPELSSATGLATLSEQPIVRLAEGTSEEYSAYLEHAVQLINTALPVDKRIRLSPEPAPPLTAIEGVPDGQIFVDFAPSADDWNLGESFLFPFGDVALTEVDPSYEFNEAGRRWESTGMRAGHLWFDREVLDTRLNTAWVWNPDTRGWETRESGSRVAESNSVNRYYPDGYIHTRTVYGLLRALGLLRQVNHADFPTSIFRNSSLSYITHLSEIDGAALLAAYGRLEPGTQPEDLSAESLGPWDDTSFHLRGDLDLEGGDAAFGVAFRNGFARPWAMGTAPLANLENNSALFGTASWNGALLGFTPAAETVAGEARLTVELRTLDAGLAFTGLERWGKEEAPGRAGTGVRWGDGDLDYSVEIRGNSFHRSGGDEGEVTGAFFGAAHEAMGGVLERSDLSAGFGGVR